MKKRFVSLPLVNMELQLPCFFPSISSIKTNLTPLEYLKILVSLRHPYFLISAYDIYIYDKDKQEEIFNTLSLAIDNGQIILLDSGNYESYWIKDVNWTENKFHDILKQNRFHISFSFDFQNPNTSIDDIIKTISKRVLNEQTYFQNGFVVPIIHAPSEILVATVLGVVDALKPIMLAIPERLLGDGILTRAKMLYLIRKNLNDTGSYYPIHLLGTGSPKSILLFSACGADTFDGLEWCQTTVDHETGLLHHFHQREFFAKQSDLSYIAGLPYTVATLVHNLEYYKSFMAELNKRASEGTLIDLIKSHFSANFVEKLMAQIPEVFE